MRGALLVVSAALLAAGCQHRQATSGRLHPGPVQHNGRPTNVVVRYNAGTTEHPTRAALRLRCAPPAGDYADPARACRALAVVLRAGRHAGVCDCIVARPAGTITGVYGGRRIRIRIDLCDLCGTGRATYRALSILEPRPGA